MRTPAAYQMHDDFVDPARKQAELWRFAAGMVLAAFAYIMLNQIFFQIVHGFISGDRGQFLRDVQRGSSPLAMYMLLFTFGFMSLSVGISAQLLHKRSFASLLGPLRACMQDFFSVTVVVVAVMMAVLILPPWNMGGPFVSNMPLSTWALLLAPSLVFVLIQTSAEEIVFRGYVQQQLAARFSSPLIWMVLPAALFALGHYLPDTAGDNALMIAVWAGTFGILMADLTARAGNLGPAIAVHFWNNVSAILIISLPGDLSGLALYLTPFGMDDTEALRAWLPVDFVMMIVLWLGARLAIRR